MKGKQVYKDINKQREANKQIQARRRQQGMTKGVTDQGVTAGVTVKGVTDNVTPKRQTFTDLPADVQHTIDRISDSPEERAVRTAIAVDYQAKHPGSQHKGIDYEAEPRGTAKPGDPDYQPSGIEEHCCGCGATLPQLEQPRQHTGACIACVVKGAA